MSIYEVPRQRPPSAPTMKERTYDEILKALPPRGRIESGEIQVTPDLSRDAAAGPFGILYQDRHLTLLRDPVTFPNYSMGGYLRVQEGDPTRRRVAVVLLALRPNADGSFDVAWVRQWRPPLDAWATEIPRGIILPEERPSDGALRELREETGLRDPALLIHLGEMANNSGISGTVATYYASVHLAGHRMIQREKNETEAISGLLWAPYAEWRKVVAQPPTPGRPVAPLDLFTAGAFGLAHMTGYLSRLERAWRRMYADGVLSDARVAPALRRRIEDGAETIDAVVETTAPLVVAHFRREMPALAITAEEGAASMVITGAPRLAVEWMLCTSEVTAIRPL